MNLPPPPKPISVVAAALAAFFCAGVFIARTAFPPLRMLNNPRIAELRNEQAHLAPFSDAAAHAAAAKLGELRGRFWTEALFNRWIGDTASKVWIVQSLRAREPKQLHDARTAFPGP